MYVYIYIYIYIYICMEIGAYIIINLDMQGHIYVDIQYTNTSLNRPIWRLTLNGPFSEVVGLES